MFHVIFVRSRIIAQRIEQTPDVESDMDAEDGQEMSRAKKSILWQAVVAGGYQRTRGRVDRQGRSSWLRLWYIAESAIYRAKPPCSATPASEILYSGVKYYSRAYSWKVV